MPNQRSWRVPLFNERPFNVLGGDEQIIGGYELSKLALQLTSVLAHLLFEVSTTDPATFAMVPLLVIMVALLACYLPARRASQVDPIAALRCE